MPTEQFAKLGCCMGCLGMFVRNFQCFIKIVHHLIFFVLIGQYFMIFFTEDCKLAEHKSTKGTELIVTVGEMYD